MVPIEDRASTDAGALAVLREHLGPLSMMHDVVRWIFSLDPPGDVVDVIMQDEFTHDVIVRWQQGGYLVFDTT